MSRNHEPREKIEISLGSRQKAATVGASRMIHENTRLIAGEFTSLLLEDPGLAEMLEPAGIFVLEKRPSEPMPSTSLWKVIRARAYGATEVVFLQRATTETGVQAE